MRQDKADRSNAVAKLRKKEKEVQEILEEGETLSKRQHDFEGSASYAKRLRQIAVHLPKRLVDKCLAKMKGNIDEAVASKGRHTRLD